jgi:hypothetical protein
VLYGGELYYEWPATGEYLLLQWQCPTDAKGNPAGMTIVVNKLDTMASGDKLDWELAQGYSGVCPKCNGNQPYYGPIPGQRTAIPGQLTAIPTAAPAPSVAPVPTVPISSATPTSSVVDAPTAAEAQQEAPSPISSASPTSSVVDAPNAAEVQQKAPSAAGRVAATAVLGFVAAVVVF